MTVVTFFVGGEPIPQGSAKAFVVGKRAVVTHDNKRTRPWRDQVSQSCYLAWQPREPTTGPVSVVMTFTMPRPKSVRRESHTVKPDLDKLVRAVIDGLVDGEALHDDAQVIALSAVKNYVSARDPQPGVNVIIRALEASA